MTWSRTVRRRQGAVRPAAAVVLALVVGTGVAACSAPADQVGAAPVSPSTPAYRPTAAPGSALALLSTVPVKGRAARSGYDREGLFGPPYADLDRNGCDQRNDVLRRDLDAVSFRPGTRDCVVVAGTLADPYTGRVLSFRKAAAAAVQIDHVVALSDAWQTGAQAWPAPRRAAFANDPLNLLAVDGPTNAAKGDGDAATWLPPNPAYRCA